MEANTTEPPKYTIKQMILYKLDRAIVIIGLVLLGGYALYQKQMEIAALIIGGLVNYVGGRGNSKG